METSGGFKGDVLQTEGVVVLGIVGAFPRTQQEEKPDDQHVGNSLALGGGVSMGTGVLDKGDGDGLDLVWGRVSLGVALGQILEFLFSQILGVEPGVQAVLGPQTDLLGNGA